MRPDSKLVMLFEGSDAAGKGGTIKRFMEHLNPRGTSVVALTAPSERERGQWYFQRYVLEHLPTRGEIDAVRPIVVQPCRRRTSDGVLHRRRSTTSSSGRCRSSRGCWRVGDHDLVKLWFSVSRREQIARFTIRRIDPVRQWKLSPSDLASLDRWDEYTTAKEAMFLHSHTEHAPWTVVRSNDKKRGRVEAIRFVLNRLDYPGKDEAVVGRPDPLIVGPPSVVAADAGERSPRSTAHSTAWRPTVGPAPRAWTWNGRTPTMSIL